MDATTLNTIVGICGLIVGILGTCGVIKIRSIKNKNMSVNNTNGDVQQANTIENHGFTGKEFNDALTIVLNGFGKQRFNMVTHIDDVEKLIISNPKYSIPLVWVGTSKEYNELKERNEIISNAVYMVTDK